MKHMVTHLTPNRWPLILALLGMVLVSCSRDRNRPGPWPVVTCDTLQLSEYEYLDTGGVFFSHSANVAYTGDLHGFIRVSSDHVETHNSDCSNAHDPRTIDSRIELRIEILPAPLVSQTDDSISKVTYGKVLSLYIWNSTDSCLNLGYSDVITGDFEAKALNGDWLPMNTLCSGCAISFPKSTYLSPGQLAIVLFDYHEGMERTTIRYRIGNAVSNEIPLMLDPKWMDQGPEIIRCWC